MKRKRRITWQWLLVYTAILMLAYAARTLRLAYGDLTFDEVATVFVANRSLIDILRYLLEASREHPPLYYLGMSLWFNVAGTSEFAVRYPSALIGVVTAAWGIHIGKHLFSKEGSVWASLLLAILPFSVWVGRNSRMYSMVILLTLINLDLYRRLVQRPDRYLGAKFVIVTLLGVFTHYYMLLLWPAEGLLLLMLPKKTRHLRKFWLIATLSAALILGLFLGISSGARATFLEVANRFPARGFRFQDLKQALMELYLHWHDPTLNEEFWIAIGLTILGWVFAWRRDTITGALLATTGIVPVVITNYIPVAIEARYLVLIVPSLVFGLTALLTWLRPHWLRLALMLIVLLQINARWDRLRLPPDTTFSKRMARLHQVSQPDDALIMNGPWPALLLTYYEPPDNVTVYRVPESAPPGFDGEVDIPRLEEIATKHERIWVSYGAVSEADPAFGVSNWLARNMYCVERYQNLVLYVPPPKTVIQTADLITLAPQLQISDVKINRQEFTPGEFLAIRMIWNGPQLNWRIRPTLTLQDDQDQVWVEESFSLGPEQRLGNINLSSPWITRRGFRIPPGTPPGRYILKLQIESKSFALANGTQRSEWIPLTEVSIVQEAGSPPVISGEYHLYLPMILKNRGELASEPIMQPGLYAIPNSNDVEAGFGGKLTLLGYETGADEIVQGYPLDLTLWWQAQVDAPQARLKVHLKHRDATVQSYELGPSFYPVTDWRGGDVIKQMISYPIPRLLPPGIYEIEIQLVDDNEEPLEILGNRNALTFLERIQSGQHSLEGTWGSIAAIEVEEMQRTYHPPLFRRSVNIAFGDVLKLRGYNIESREVRASETTELTEYWQAQRSPDRIYAVFNHLKAEDGTLIWQKDSWPQSGTYTTNYWVADEVVSESYVIQIPPDTPVGEYTLYVGAYDPTDASTRLPAVNAQGERLLHDQVSLLTLKVTP